MKMSDLDPEGLVILIFFFMMLFVTALVGLFGALAKAALHFFGGVPF